MNKVKRLDKPLIVGARSNDFGGRKPPGCPAPLELTIL
jgi:hypothetical protein